MEPRVVWASVQQQLIEQLPTGDHGPLHALRVAFNRLGAQTMTALFHILDGAAAFTGPEAESNLRKLSEVLEPWGDIDAVVALRDLIATLNKDSASSKRVRLNPSPTDSTVHRLHAPAVLLGRDELLGRATNFVQTCRAEARPPVVLLVPPDGIPGGTGKTTAARALAAHLYERSIQTGGQIDVKLVTGNNAPLDTLEAMREVLMSTCGPGAAEMARDDASIRQCYARLFQPGGALYDGVLVLDDAKSEEQICSLLPTACRTALIVTSRFTLSLPVALGALRETVGTLPLPLAVDWLQRGLTSCRGPTLSQEDIAHLHRLAELCSGIALALQLVEKRLRRSGKTIRLCDLVARYQRDRQDYASDLDASLATSFSLLDHDALRDSLKRCAVISVPFHREVFEALYDETQAAYEGNSRARRRCARLQSAVPLRVRPICTPTPFLMP